MADNDDDNEDNDDDDVFWGRELGVMCLDVIHGNNAVDAISRRACGYKRDTPSLRGRAGVDEEINDGAKDDDREDEDELRDNVVSRPGIRVRHADAAAAA